MNWCHRSRISVDRMITSCATSTSSPMRLRRSRRRDFHSSSLSPPRRSTPLLTDETAALRVASFALRSLRDVRAGRLEVELRDPIRHLPAEDAALDD